MFVPSWSWQVWSVLLVGGLTGGLVGCAAQLNGAETQVPVTFSGGHEIDRRKDFGRPTILIAAALGVKQEVFRQAFSGVTPSRGGPPSGDEARKNKQALMSVLAPHGISNDRLDEVSNFYRFRPQGGEIWSHKDAAAYAVVDGGKIKKIVVTEPGYGYSSPLTATVAGFESVKLEVKLQLSTDLKKNGSVAAVTIAMP
ncbi:MAG: hypothetical protein C0483_20685 [Pirellula sp.]|nr:hypothetical protein [Pirellula sp.]